MQTKIGVMGGSFDPPHYAHLFFALEALKTFNLQKVIFIPTYISPLKVEEEITPPYHRLQMIQLAIEGIEEFEVSDIEIRRKGISYTVDTLKELRKILGENVQIYFLAGSDSAHTLSSWKNPEEILSLSHMVVFERPGYPLEKIEKKFLKKIIPVKTLLLGISSSEIRKRVREGKPIRFLVPPSVEKYIYQNKLYQR